MSDSNDKPVGLSEYLKRVKEDLDKPTYEIRTSRHRAGKASKHREDWLEAYKYPSISLPIDNMKLNASGNWNPSPYIWDDTSETEQPKPAPTCEHNFVDVGFNFSKFVCSKCDAEKGE